MFLELTSKHNKNDDHQVLCWQCAQSSYKTYGYDKKQPGKKIVKYVDFCRDSLKRLEVDQAPRPDSTCLAPRKKVVPKALDQIKFNYDSRSLASTSSMPSIIVSPVPDDAVGKNDVKQISNIQIKSENVTDESTDFGPSLNESMDEVFIEAIFDPDVELETEADVKPIIKFEKSGELKVKKEVQASFADDTNIHDNSVDLSMPTPRWKKYRIDSNGNLVKMALRVVVQSELSSPGTNHSPGAIQNVTMEFPILRNINDANANPNVGRNQLNFTPVELQDQVPILPVMNEENILDLNDQINRHAYANLKEVLFNVLQYPSGFINGILNMFQSFVGRSIRRVILSLAQPVIVEETDNDQNMEQDLDVNVTGDSLLNCSMNPGPPSMIGRSDLDLSIASVLGRGEDASRSEADVISPINLCKSSPTLLTRIQNIKAEKIKVGKVGRSPRAVSGKIRASRTSWRLKNKSEQKMLESQATIIETISLKKEYLTPEVSDDDNN